MRQVLSCVHTHARVFVANALLDSCERELRSTSTVMRGSASGSHSVGCARCHSVAELAGGATCYCSTNHVVTRCNTAHLAQHKDATARAGIWQANRVVTGSRACLWSVQPCFCLMRASRNAPKHAAAR